MSTFDASRQQSIRSSATEHGIRLASGEELEAELVVTPVVPDEAVDWEAVPLIDLRSGYVLRSIDRLPRQARRRRGDCYRTTPGDVRLRRRGPVHDDGLRFGRVTSGLQLHPL